jgi:hypothetical protein
MDVEEVHRAPHPPARRGGGGEGEEGEEGMSAAIDAMARVAELAPFLGRGLGNRTIDALIEHGLDAPERLLFMAEADLRAIPGIGKISLAEIKAYRRKFQPSAAELTPGAFGRRR